MSYYISFVLNYESDEENHLILYNNLDNFYYDDSHVIRNLNSI